MRVFIYEPNLPEYPDAKWPGVVCFSGEFKLDECRWRKRGSRTIGIKAGVSKSEREAERWDAEAERRMGGEGKMASKDASSSWDSFADLLLSPSRRYPEIYQVTGPVERVSSPPINVVSF